MLNKQKLDEILEPTVNGLGYEYICSELTSTNYARNSGGILRIFIDKLPASNSLVSDDNNSNETRVGVTLDDCQLVSRHINRVLEVEAESASNYNLEVSSPGLERPLVKLEHFRRFIGNKVKIKLNNGLNNQLTGNIQKNLVGYIKEVSDNEVITISSADKVNANNIIYIIELNNISKANLVPQWS